MKESSSGVEGGRTVPARSPEASTRGLLPTELSHCPLGVVKNCDTNPALTVSRPWRNCLYFVKLGCSVDFSYLQLTTSF